MGKHGELIDAYVTIFK